MLRFFLLTILLLFMVWFLRRFLQGLLGGIKPLAEHEDNGSAAARTHSSKVLDLVRDEKTGEYRVKDD